MLGKKLQEALKYASISTADAATYIGISEANLYKLFKKESFEVAYLIKAAALLQRPVSYFLEELATENSHISAHKQADASQQVPVAQGHSQQDLAAALAACQRELALAKALVAAKDETLILLRASISRST